ncbi:dienelactone hydrolase family protein [Dokdonella sp.]|uniref:dienelactone hydrolase family protein n=1 Tax=Dokdonella sp. TaxID=2291710 RepID=UPI00378320C3
MGHAIQLNTTRLHCIGAWLARPEGKAKAGLVVAQEIFGVNAHMRAVVDRFAAHGYVTIAPAFFDHVETGVELGYDQEGFRRGRELAGEVGLARAVEDVASAAETIASAGRIGCVGYCWGGTVALLAATRLGLPSVSYYGARNVNFLGEAPRAPLMLHFGERDASIPAEAIDKQRAAWPQAELHVYPSGHAFDRTVDPNAFDPSSAHLAFERTLAFFDRHLATESA